MSRAWLMLAALSWPLLAGAETLEVPEEYRMAVATASARGMAMFIHDASAARASDELMRRKIFEGDARLQGWITENEADHSGVLVDFVGDDGGKPAMLYRVRVPVGDAELQYQAFKPAQVLGASQLARWAARQEGARELETREDLCSKRYNSVVVSPDPAPDGLIHVYMLAATDQVGVIVAGGHFRYDYSPDGKILESQRAFTKACFNLEAPQEAQGKPVAFMLTHLLDPTPTEIHVYLSRLHRQAVFVATEAGMWSVDGGKIKFVERREK